MSYWTERRYSEVTAATRHRQLHKASAVKCQRCGAQSKVRHHDDYTKPLEITYLCQPCHIARHKELGWGVGGRKKGLHEYNFSLIPVGNFAIVPSAKQIRINQR